MKIESSHSTYMPLYVSFSNILKFHFLFGEIQAILFTGKLTMMNSLNKPSSDFFNFTYRTQDIRDLWSA